ncbi:hypothetical protein GSI_12805 [Ganoderma sinense ZZ0214-1]|uniref:DNL-type domain-containing protein n=1 Tax=Ganoderma sinense ZZ0214-1 TaxID=1077348 RepID=A0A2G8RUA7_9APHY|nr:hypothetical protein GSI_12805 [Ganoderma sinense ZZ0214-1]
MLSLRQAFRLLQHSVLAPPKLSSSMVHHAFHYRGVAPSNLRNSARTFSSSLLRLRDDSSAPTSRPADQASRSASEASGASAPQSQTHITLEPPEPKLSMTFTCTVEGCGYRSTHQFTKRSYTSGIVLVQCPGCKNRLPARHLIADHLGWFKESTEDGKLKTVEDLLRVKGEKVRRGRIDAGGVVEYAPE